MNRNYSQGRVYLLLFMGIFAVSFSAIFIRKTMAPASIIAMYRMLITFLLLSPITLMTRWEEIKKIAARDFFLCALSGVFLALHFISWISSLNYTTIASSTVLVGLQPIFTAILGYLLYQERLSKLSIVGMLIAILGSSIMGILDLQINLEHLFGDALALLGALFASFYILIGRGVRRRISTTSYVFFTYGICWIVLLIINLLSGLALIGYSPIDYTLFLLMAVICTIGGHTIFNWALGYIEANKVSVAMLGEPIGATILAMIFLSETPDFLQLISGGLIVLGLYIFITFDNRR